MTVTVDGNGSQVHEGRDVSGGRIFAGWAPDLVKWRGGEKHEVARCAVTVTEPGGEKHEYNP